MYLSNEEATPVEVYFDDLKVTQIKSPVVQTDDYYPFGLAFNEYQKEGSLINNYQYNGKEKQDELSLGWSDFGARFYDPTICRWIVIDVMSESRAWLTPFNYVQDNPIVLIDPTGMLDVYSLDKQSGEINFVKAQEGNDVLVDKETNKTIDNSVERGILRDGMNIQKNGLETSKVQEGINLAINISMHVGKEVTGTTYENADGDQMLNVLPYEKAETYTDKEGHVTGMGTGHSSEITETFKSKDGAFTGNATSTFHTHPGHPENPKLGYPIPSSLDRMGAVSNGIGKDLRSFPHHIFAAKSATIDGKTSNHSIYQVKKSPFGPKAQTFHNDLADPWKP